MNHHIEAFESSQDPLCALSVTGELRSAASPSSIQSTEGRLRIDLARKTERPIDQSVIKTSRCYQRRNGHTVIKTSICNNCRADGQRQVGTGAPARRTGGGVIVNADSAQIYRDLPILSAAPGPDERARAEHRLYGVLDGAKSCSAADWAELAKREIADIHWTRRLPVLVGGTGLYLRTLLDGIAPIPPIDPNVRRKSGRSRSQTNSAS